MTGAAEEAPPAGGMTSAQQGREDPQLRAFLQAEEEPEFVVPPKFLDEPQVMTIDFMKARKMVAEIMELGVNDASRKLYLASLPPLPPQ